VVYQYAYRGRMRKSEGFQIVTSKIALAPKLPINKDGLRFLPKLQKKVDLEKQFWRINATKCIDKGISRKNEAIQSEGFFSKLTSIFFKKLMKILRNSRKYTIFDHESMKILG